MFNELLDLSCKICLFALQGKTNYVIVLLNTATKLCFNCYLSLQKKRKEKVLGNMITLFSRFTF